MKSALFKLGIPVLALPRLTKRFIVLLLDLSLCALTVWIAYYLRLGEFVALSGNALLTIGVSICLALPIFVVCGLYRAIFRYSGWPALLAVSRAVAVYGLLYSSIFTVIGRCAANHWDNPADFIVTVCGCLQGVCAGLVGGSIQHYPKALCSAKSINLWRWK
jgi:hypothetical protein